MGFGQLHSERDSWKKMCRPAGDGHVGVCGASPVSTKRVEGPGWRDLEETLRVW